MADSKKKQTFEQKVEELETIIERIERAEIGLEESVAQRKRAGDLLKACRAVVETAQQEMEQLTAEKPGSTGGRKEPNKDGDSEPG